MVRSFRDTLAETLTAEVSQNDKIIVLTPDLARAVRIHGFAKDHAENFVSCGISEANLIGVAAGLASVGMEPVVVGFSMFVSEKPYEQIRNIIAYPNFNVKIIATHGGMCVGQDGATHQAVEDLAIMRVLPNMKVLAASDVCQTRKIIHELCETEGPGYLRLGRDKAEDIYGEDADFPIGGACVLREGTDTVIFATGLLLMNALKAAQELEQEGIHAAVVNTYSIKPLGKDVVETYLRKCGCAVTAEDHQAAGGLGSSICELAAQVCPVPVERVGVKDVFGESGCQEDLYEKYGLDVPAIKEAVKKAVARKSYE